MPAKKHFWGRSLNVAKIQGGWVSELISAQLNRTLCRREQSMAPTYWKNGGEQWMLWKEHWPLGWDRQLRQHHWWPPPWCAQTASQHTRVLTATAATTTHCEAHRLSRDRGYSAAEIYFYIRRNPVINICSRLIAFILFTVHRIHIHAWNNTPDMTFHFYAPYNTLQSFALATLPDGLTSLSHQYQHHHLMAIHIVQCTLYTLHSADCQCTACIAQDGTWIE